MRGGQGEALAPVIQFTNCRILRGRVLLREDLWVRGGRILDPEKLFFEERRVADEQRDCGGCILAPGFIDVQINGGFGVDFSQATEDVGSGVALVARRILSHGVTSFCPTLVTSPPEVYRKVLPQIPVKSGGPHGAGVLGVHLEGPFISREKRGAHPEAHLRSFEANAFQDVLATYGGLDNVRIVTLAPELGRSHEVIQALTALGICVSLGHSVADLGTAEEAVQSGATFITHLFNAMLPFHHRDPGIVGLLTSDQLPPGRHIFYGMIADGIHTNPAALRIAQRAHPEGLVLVTDAVPALGLGNGRHTLGQQEVEVNGLTAYVAGTNTLSGSIAPMDTCVRHFLRATVAALPLLPSHRSPLTQTSWCSMTLSTSGPPTSRASWCGRRRRPDSDQGPPLEGVPSPCWTLLAGSSRSWSPESGGGRGLEAAAWINVCPVGTRLVSEFCFKEGLLLFLSSP
ncbi:N-acetylglucosamine-6-phosphate deacetylase isoform X1 [Hippopotamus amphibius kiboko]|uniref:N-acetylglucosamine-6-phosphate deacetylase isoform X1 n=1 Tax=Hippopotamus amphibius kiboko TaxID=575201 RepID=UPI00259574E7|nr:N-acetylglucosamine-6-phosphate deacetylase isoform X1 [Hippopotamus amphibius kiboko]